LSLCNVPISSESLLLLSSNILFVTYSWNTFKAYSSLVKNIKLYTHIRILLLYPNKIRYWELVYPSSQTSEWRFLRIRVQIPGYKTEAHSVITPEFWNRT